jgi:hypothetical protein
MKTMTTLLALSAAGILLPLSLSWGTGSEDHSTTLENPSRALEGSWKVTVTVPEKSLSFEALATYAGGGGYIFTDTIPNPVSATPGHGAWEFVNPGLFNANFVKFNFNMQGEIDSILKVRARITLDDTENRYTSVERVEVRNLAGELIFAREATTVAMRMSVEPID